MQSQCHIQTGDVEQEVGRKMTRKSEKSLVYWDVGSIRDEYMFIIERREYKTKVTCDECLNGKRE